MLPLPTFAQTTLLFEDDFEIQDASEWQVTQTNGTVDVLKTLPHSGSWSVRHTLNSGTVNTLMRRDFAPSAVAYGRAFFYLDPMLTVTGDLQIAQMLNSGSFSGQRVYLRNASGTLYIKLEGHTTPGTTAIGKGAWHSLELKYDASAGSAAVYLDGSATPEVSAAGLTLRSADVLRIGVFGTATGAIYFDDAAVATPAPGAASANSAIGAAPANVKVRHANSFGRSALPLYATLWGQAPNDNLTVVVNGVEVSRKAGSISGSETPVLNMTGLTAGTYTVAVKLLDANDVLKAQWSESIRKYINGASTVSIDANNSISRNGSLIFPVTPFMQNPSEWVPYWTNGWVNLYGWASGYATSYSQDQYKSFIETIGQPSIGPNVRFCNNPATFCVNEPNAVTLASGYATLLKDHPDVLMWAWIDEPDLGGNTPRVLPAKIQAITDAVHDIDANHPQILNLYGYVPAQTRNKGFLYPNLVSDIYGFDMYPAIYQRTGATFAGWVNNIDLWQRYNYGLTPWFTFIEAGIQPCSDPPACTGGHGPTAAQLRMEAWLAVVHGIKGISWWGPETPSFTYIDAAHKAEMAKFVDQIGRLKNVVLSAPSARTVTNNATSPGSRVDTMLREDAANVWVFAVRLTDFGEEANPPLNVQLGVSGIDSGVAEVFDENRQVTVANGSFFDFFNPHAVHIYRIPKVTPAPPTALRATVK